MSKEKGRPPSHSVVVQDDEEHWHEVGVAWPLENGGLSLRFNPFLDWTKLAATKGLLVKPRNKKPEKSDG